MALIEWTPALMVNVAELDKQHQVLVSMINKLHDAMKTGQGRNSVTDILKKMSDYVELHFSTEEKLMAQYAYPGLLSQKAEHQKFTGQIETFRKDVEAGKTTITMDLMNFLRTWLTGHIQVIDRKYTDFFASKGVRQRTMTARNGSDGIARTVHREGSERNTHVRRIPRQTIQYQPGPRVDN